MKIIPSTVVRCTKKYSKRLKQWWAIKKQNKNLSAFFLKTCFSCSLCWRPFLMTLWEFSTKFKFKKSTVTVYDKWTKWEMLKKKHVYSIARRKRTIFVAYVYITTERKNCPPTRYGKDRLRSCNNYRISKFHFFLFLEFSLEQVLLTTCIVFSTR